MLQKNPTQNLGHNRKLNPTVTLKKGNSVTAWDISVLSVCHRGSTCFGEIFLHVYFMLEHFPLPREKSEGAKICCRPRVSSPMFYVLLVLMGNHTIPELVVTQKLKYCADYSQDVQGAECPSFSRWLQPTVSYNHNIKYYNFCMLCLGKDAKV